MAGPIRISILANGSQARREISGLNRTLGGLGKGAALLGVGGLAAGLVGFAKSAVDAERAFSTNMRLIQASTKATDQQMQQLNDQAVKLGADTSFSAGEASTAMLELARAGLTTKQIMGGGVAATLTLAAAGGTDLATASTIASNAMNTFNIKARDMDKIAAALAGGANASTASVESLGQALQQVGPGATNAGLSLQETVAALAAFDSAGIKGSDAGTSLKTMLARLVPQTTKATKAMEELGLDFVKGNGEFESLTNIAGQLQARLGKLAPAQRQVALNTIFGSDASRAATGLLKEGEQGIREFIKATKDQAAAQEAAAARMGGTEGALERLSGAIETAKLRLGQELAPAVAAGADALGDKLVPAMEAGIDAGYDIAHALTPAVSEIVEALGHLAGEGDAVGKMFDGVFLPAVEAAAKAVGGLVDFVDNLPGPVKDIGVQVGIAALVFPKLATGVASATGAITLQIARLKQLQAELTYTATRTQVLNAAMARMSAAARTAAGIGGMVLLSEGMQQADDETRTLMTTLGGLATGFALGGPWGAAIGGAVGLIGGLSGAFGTTEAEARALRQEQARTEAIAEQKAKIDALKGSLDQLTGAYTKTTRAAVFQRLEQDELVAQGAEFGLSARTLVDAALGQEAAIRKVSRAVNDQGTVIHNVYGPNGQIVSSYTAASGEVSDFAASLGVVSDDLREAQRATRLAADATESLAKRLGITGKELEAIPKNVRIKIRDDVPDSLREIKRLARETGNLDRKTIKILLNAVNLEPTQKRIKAIQGELDKTDRKRTNARVGMDDRDFVGKNKRLLNELQTLDRRQVNPKTSLALDDYYRRRAALIASLNSIPDEYVNIWVTRRDAGGGGGNAGERTNPRTTLDRLLGDRAGLTTEVERTGVLLGKGIATGMKRAEPTARKAGKSLLAKILDQLGGGTDQVDSALDKLTRYIQKRIDLKDAKAERARERAVLKHLKDEYEALRRNARAQDEINRKLERAKQHLAEVRQFVDTIRQSFIETGNVTQLGLLEDGTVSGSLLIDQLRDQVAQAERFAQIIRNLTDSSGAQINQTTLEQLLAAGPEAGLATAEALIAGGDAAIAEINALTQQLTQTGQQLGSQMSDQFFDVGLQAAQGIVDGLQARQAELDRIARRLARQLAAAVRKALGIKSPSTVFRDIGTETVKGLAIGLDDTYVRRAGSVTAKALVDGFGRPALEAWASGASGSEAPVFELDLTLTADVIDEIQAGKRLQRRLDVATSTGVRKLALSVGG